MVCIIAVHTPKRCLHGVEILMGHLGEVVAGAEEASLGRQNDARRVTLPGVDERLGELFHQREREDVETLGIDSTRS